MKYTISNYLLLLISLAIGCSTSKTSKVERSQEKNYEIALDNLKKGKSLEKNKKLLINSINAILKSQTTEKDGLINSELLEEKEKGYEISEYLYRKLEASKEYIEGQFDSQMISLNRERIELKKYLKESFYTKGKIDFEKAKKRQDKYLSRKAYKSLEKSKKYGNEEINNLIKEYSEYSFFYYYVKAKASESEKYEILIDAQFRKLEKLEFPFVKIHYNKRDAIKYDCEIDILFDELTIKDEESSNNKSFSKIKKQEGETEGGNVTVIGYVHQRKKKRKLNWDIIMKINSDSNNCKLKNNSFTESLISKSVDNTLSGDERAISKKYKKPMGELLLSKREMTEEAIIRVYEKIEYRLKTNQMTTDGTEIIDGDTANDTYWGIMDLYDNGGELKTILNEFPLEQAKYCDDFDNEIYVTSCGLAYWELGLMTPERIEYIKGVISKDVCVKQWTRYTEKEGESRKSVLERYLTKISKPNKWIRKREENRKISSFIFSENSILTFQLSNGEYAVSACVEIDQVHGNCHYWLVPITYKSISKPTIEKIRETEILGKMIENGSSRKQIMTSQPGIEKIWKYVGGKPNTSFGFAIHGIEHKDFMKIKDKFEKIGELNIINGFKEVGTLGYENSYERYDEIYSKLEEQTKMFGYEKIPIEIVLKE